MILYTFKCEKCCPRSALSVELCAVMENVLYLSGPTSHMWLLKLLKGGWFD